MKSIHNNKFLKKYMFGKLIPAEYTELKEYVKSSSSQNLDNTLKDIWEQSDISFSLNSDIKLNTLSKVYREIIWQQNKKILYNWLRIAAIILLPLILFITSYFYSTWESAPEQLVVFTEKGNKTQVLLPDGTHVWLNSDTKLTYPSDFNISNRKVTLEGQAFFDVKEEKREKFVVTTDLVDIVVHGTAFDVSAYKEENINVSLLRGKISLEDINHKPLIEMKPNQLVSISRTNQTWTLSDCDAETECLWTNNILKFENATFQQVFYKLERWYGVNFHVENPDTTIRYGFTLKNESVREMLDVINQLTPLTYQINGKEVNIEYR